jgi:hypothetical protein
MKTAACAKQFLLSREHALSSQCHAFSLPDKEGPERKLFHAMATLFV